MYLERDTRKEGFQELPVVKEVDYLADNGMKTTIPYNPEWNTLLVQVSGGLDSALLLYLTAKTLKDLDSKVKILPLTLEVPTKVKNLSSGRAVINSVRELIGYDHLLKGEEVSIPKDQAGLEGKNSFFTATVKRMFRERNVSFEFNGNTKNPPEEARKSFRDDQFRELHRDNRTTIYNSRFSASPHAQIDKSGIVGLYKKFGIVDALAIHTLSCDIDLEEQIARGLPTPCGECWWCRERAWGFESNGLSDPSLN